jgi:hypothetical protein
MGDRVQMSERAKLIAWIETRVRKAPVEIDLQHHRGDKVESFEIEENESLEDVVGRIFESATEDAKGMFGPQGYWVLLRNAGTKDVISRKSISVDGELYEKGLGSESPDQWGLTGQTMRHQETTLKMVLQHIAQSNMNMQREHERMAAQLTEMSRVEIERMAMSRQLAQDVANQRVEEARIIAQAKRDEWLMKQADLLLPLVGSKILGEGKAGPIWAKETETLINLVRVLRPDQLDRLMLIFDAPSRTLVMAIAQGEITMGFAPVCVQRIMSALSEDQYAAIFRVLDTDEQRSIFRDLFAVRKHSLAWAEGQPTEQPRYLPTNGSSSTTASLPAAGAGGTVEGEASKPS